MVDWATTIHKSQSIDVKTVRKENPKNGKSKQTFNIFLGNKMFYFTSKGSKKRIQTSCQIGTHHSQARPWAGRRHGSHGGSCICWYRVKIDGITKTEVYQPVWRLIFQWGFSSSILRLMVFHVLDLKKQPQGGWEIDGHRQNMIPITVDSWHTSQLIQKHQLVQTSRYWVKRSPKTTSKQNLFPNKFVRP